MHEPLLQPTPVCCKCLLGPPTPYPRYSHPFSPSSETLLPTVLYAMQHAPTDAAAEALESLLVYYTMLLASTPCLEPGFQGEPELEEHVGHLVDHVETMESPCGFRACQRMLAAVLMRHIYNCVCK